MSNSGKTQATMSGGKKFLIALAVIFMPYLGIFLVLIKKPFSAKVTKICSIYCVAMCIAVGVMMATQFGGNRDNTPVNNPAGNTPVISDTDESKDSVVYDVSQFAAISGKELIAILGEPNNIEESTCKGEFEMPCVYYDYDDIDTLGEVSFALVNNSVVRLTAYGEYPFTGETILNNYGITAGENCVISQKTDMQLEYRAPSDTVDEFQVNLINGDTFEMLRVTYEMKYYNEWYVPMSISTISKWQYTTQEAVKQLLKSPKSADFPSYTSWNYGENDYYIVMQSYVDAQNSFGAEIRSDFTFIYLKGTGEIAYAVFDGKVIADNEYIKTNDIIMDLYNAEAQSVALKGAAAN